MRAQFARCRGARRFAQGYPSVAAATRRFDLATRALAALGAMLVLASVACVATPRAATHVTVVTVGSAVAAIHAEHQRAYREATDAVRRDLAARGGTLADYDRATAQMTAEFQARSEALVSLDAALYAAAAINDATRDGAPRSALRAAARRVLAAVERALAALDASRGLPRVRVPAEVRGLLDSLTGLAVGGSDVDG